MMVSNGTRSSKIWLLLGLIASAILVIASLSFLVWASSSRKVDRFADPLKSISTQSEELVKATIPAIVRIRVKKQSANTKDDELAVLFSDKLALPDEDLGSGFFIDGKGTILTNYHVVKNAASIEVITFDGKKSTAQVIGTDALTDIAVIKGSFDETWPLAWGDSNKLQGGSIVWAFGSPFGLENSVSLGIVSAFRNSEVSRTPFGDFIQTDVAINPGSSGGPLVNQNGQVVGVNAAIAGDQFRGISFAIPSALARKVAEELIRTGKIERGWLGVELSPMTPDRSRRAGLSDIRGVYIENVPPADGGQLDGGEPSLKVGDICLDVGGTTIDDPVAFVRSIASAEVGSTVRMTIVRDGKQLTLSVPVKKRPAKLQ